MRTGTRNQGLRVAWGRRVAVAAILLMAGAAPTLAAPVGDTIEDQDVTVALQTELLVDEAVPSHKIDVETQDGVVILSGTVDSLLAKDRAVKTAEAMKGVRSVVDQIEVMDTERSDPQIRTDVVEALASDPAADSYELDVDVEDGRVTLSGTVESFEEKDLSSIVAKGVKGVQGVSNLVTVDYETDRPDHEIESEIERRLETDVKVDEMLMDVEVDEGVVSLSGTVGSAAEKTRAETDAWVAGVDDVKVDDLDVKWWARDDMRRKRNGSILTDAEIHDAVKDAFLYDPRVASFQPEIDVDNGMVTLTGDVTSLSAKRAAGDTARNTTGVWRVRNLLSVRPEVTPADAVLAENVRDALRRDPYVDRFEITVMVINGKVYLYGDVDSGFEKSWAETVAGRVDGVYDVQNSLVVSRPPQWIDDLELRQEVQDQLFWDPIVNSENVSVSVEDGVVTLTGKVATWYERRRATENAWDAGAHTVVNKLKVNHLSDFGS